MASDCLENSTSSRMTGFDSPAFLHGPVAQPAEATASKADQSQFESEQAHHAAVAQLRQRHTFERRDGVSSNLTGGTNFRARRPTWQSHRAQNAGSVGSNPTEPTIIGKVASAASAAGCKPVTLRVNIAGSSPALATISFRMLESAASQVMTSRTITSAAKTQRREQRPGTWPVCAPNHFGDCTR